MTILSIGRVTIELTTLKRLVGTESTTNTEKEKNMAQVIYDIICENEYFRENPKLCGLYQLPGDALGRKAVWALHRATTAATAAAPTVVLAGHMDTVSTDNYAGLEPLSRNPEALEEAMKAQGKDGKPVSLPLSERAEADLASGQWIFGRGTADMKGGLSVFLEQTLLGAEDKDLLFLAVPDEETYSAGMRGAANLLLELKQRFDLEYRLLLMGESHLRDQRGSVYFDGTIGKMTVNIVVRGVPSHVRFYYGAANAILLAARIAAAIDGNAALTERYLGEVTPPPSVSYFRDTKPRYDVTLAESVDLSLVQFLYRKSPDKAIADICDIAKRVAQETTEYVEEQYRAWKGEYPANVTPLTQATEVLTYGQLLERVKDHVGSDFDDWYEGEKAAVAQARREGTCSMNDATNRLIHALLNRWKPAMPVVVVALAPPMYPGFQNEDIRPADDTVMTLREDICRFCREELGYDAYFEHYFGGISDMSYAACIYGAEESRAVEENMPLWGTCYDIDFDAIRQLQIPVYNIGPFGRDIHTGLERANRRSLTEETPRLIRFVIDHVK